EDIGLRAECLAKQIVSPMKCEVVDGESLLGGGAAPSCVLPTRLIALSCDGMAAEDLCKKLRDCEFPVVARVDEGRVLLDLRTVFPEQDAVIASNLARISA